MSAPENPLLELAARCEAAEGPDRALDGVAHILANPDKPWIVGHKPGRFPQEAIHGTLNAYLEWATGLCDNADPPRRADVADAIGAPAYTASIAAALTLYVRVPERVPSNPRLATAEALRQRAEEA